MPTSVAFPIPGIYSPGYSSGVAAEQAELRRLAFLLAHIPLGILLKSFPTLADVLAIGVVALGVVWSGSQATVRFTVLAAAYVAGAEVLWRMAGGVILYEYGKYAVVVLLGLALARMPRAAAGSALPLFYFFLLMPSIVITLLAAGVTEDARQRLSFNLMGPLALAVASAFFLRTDGEQLDMRRLLITLAGPLLGVLGVAGRSTLAAARITFGGESNFVTSGGFGPNQVSAALGLGAMLCVFLGFTSPSRLARLGYFGIAVGLLVQTVLTFSRGGVLNVALALAAFGVHVVRQPRMRVAFLLTAVLGGFLAVRLVLPALDDFTGGALRARYSERTTGVRGQLMTQELEMWRENPLFGVGPGMAKDHHAAFYDRPIAAHTEYTRLLAEHGLFGLLALVLLLAMVARSYLRAPDLMTKAWVAMLGSWSLVEMSHAAMRIASISFVFGLALVLWRPLTAPAAPPRPAVGAS